jgi:hypothetical protein
MGNKPLHYTNTATNTGSTKRASGIHTGVNHLAQLAEGWRRRLCRWGHGANGLSTNPLTPNRHRKRFVKSVCVIHKIPKGLKATCFYLKNLHGELISMVDRRVLSYVTGCG